MSKKEVGQRACAEMILQPSTPIDTLICLCPERPKVCRRIMAPYGIKGDPTHVGPSFLGAGDLYDFLLLGLQWEPVDTTDI